MASTVRGKITINLIPKKRSSFAEKFFYWLLTVGRYIIIGTELVVFAVFISRFQLDTRLSDLNDKIKQEEAVVKSLEQVDANARALQIRLSEIKKLTGSQKNASDLLFRISQVVPETVSLNMLSQQGGMLTISAVSSQSKGFSVFVQNLRTLESLRNISITEVSKDETTGGVKFTITAQYGI